jgi:large subunit ribosomal protein L19
MSQEAQGYLRFLYLVHSCSTQSDLIQYRLMAKYFTYNDVQISSGDTVRVLVKIGENDGKIQTQAFEGIVIAIGGREENKSFTVRKLGADSIGVERIFPVNAPTIIKLELKKKGDVRRAKLGYLRARIGKQATKIKQLFDGAQAA